MDYNTKSFKINQEYKPYGSLACRQLPSHICATAFPINLGASCQQAQPHAQVPKMNETKNSLDKIKHRVGQQKTNNTTAYYDLTDYP